FLAELFPTAIRNTAVGSIYNLARGAQFFTPLIITAVARWADLSAGIALAAAFAVGAGLMVWTLPETRGREISEGLRRASPLATGIGGVSGQNEPPPLVHRWTAVLDDLPTGAAEAAPGIPVGFGNQVESGGGWVARLVVAHRQHDWNVAPEMEQQS